MSWLETLLVASSVVPVQTAARRPDPETTTPEQIQLVRSRRVGTVVAPVRGVWSNCFQGTSTEAKDANRHSRTQSRQGPVFGFDGGSVRRASRLGGSSLGTWYTAHTGSVA